MEYLLLAVGLFVLIKGADYLIEGASSIARKFGLPSILVGLTIVAFGTSLPEFLINIFAASRGSADLALGNVIGSNLANILLVLAVVALVYPAQVKIPTVWKEIPFGFLGALALLVLANDVFFDGAPFSVLSRSDGLVLVLFMFIFIAYLVESAIKGRVDKKDSDTSGALSASRTALYIGGGIVALYFGGSWSVSSAVAIARGLGASEFLISATIVALGTSLPELVTCVKAALKRDTDMAVGNIVGSNIFNIFWVLGATAFVFPVPVPSGLNFDLLWLLAASALLFVFMFTGGRHKLERWEGVLFLVAYALYLALIIIRG